MIESGCFFISVIAATWTAPKGNQKMHAALSQQGPAS
jgi:hypothetical protein